MSRGGRVLRMTRLLLARDVSVGSWVKSLRLSQHAVCARGGGMVFCDEATEREYFDGDANEATLVWESRTTPVLDDLYTVQAVVARREQTFYPGLCVTDACGKTALNWDHPCLSMNRAKAAALRWLCASVPLGMNVKPQARDVAAGRNGLA